MSPALSWALFLLCVAVGVTVYVVVAGGRRYRRMEREALEPMSPGFLRYDERPLLQDSWTVGEAPWVRIVPTVYDWRANDDFGDDALWVWNRDEWERYP